MGISFYIPPNMPADEAQRRTAASASNLLDPALGPAMMEVTRTAAWLADTPMAAVTVVLDDHVVILGGSGLGPGIARRSTSMCGHIVLQAPAPLCIPDTWRDARFAENPIVTGTPFIRFYFGTPLLAANGQPLGALCVFDDRPRDGIPGGVVTRLQAMAQQIVDMGRDERLT